jgi:D-beta-D-heptose 7-phosphate kinase / D-beta-D-heptose 1-phosphate adenosyltransferase
VLVTRGAQGMTLVERGVAESVHLPARTVRVFDVTGAGDTVAAMLGVALAGGMSVQQAAALANVAAGIAVANPGTVAVSGPELRSALHAEDYGRGVVSREFLSAAVEDARRAGQRIVFTNGCFDILHAGHVQYLSEAAALGDVLVVGLNDDDSVRRLKGPTRPLNEVGDRGLVLSALSAVSYVTTFGDDTPLELIRAVQPDVLVKGGDYLANDVVGADLVKLRGGSVKILSFLEGRSTTGTLQRMAKA